MRIGARDHDIHHDHDIDHDGPSTSCMRTGPARVIMTGRHACDTWVTAPYVRVMITCTSCMHAYDHMHAHDRYLDGRVPVPVPYAFEF